MRHFLCSMFFIFFIAILGGCADFRTPPVHVGDSEPKVMAALGNPTNRYRIGTEQLLEYAHGPWGQETYMARFSPDGKLVSYKQVLTNEMFAAIKIDESSKEDVLHTIGAPSERSYLSLSHLEVWSYPYKESGVWNSIMHVHFDQAGIVRKMVNLPDIRLSPERGGFPNAPGS